LRAVALKGFERRLERMVEGAFARVFRSELRPIELGRRLIREMDDNRSVGVSGRTVVPNHYSLAVSQADFDQFADARNALVRELCDAAREHARDEGYQFMGPVSVELVVDDRFHTGAFEVVSRMREGEGGAGAGSLLLQDGKRVPLGEKTVTIGRLADCDIVLSDPNVSRHHAEVRPRGDGFEVADLGSTNGTRVNGTTVSGGRQLVDGDEITVGGTRIRFEAS
jgi:hypothetical protein